MTSETESMKQQTQNEFCKLWFATMLFICFVKISSTFIELFNRIAQTRPEFRTTDNFMLSPGKSSLNWSVCWNRDRKLSNYDFNWWHFCVHHTTLAHRMLSFYFILFSFHFIRLVLIFLILPISHIVDRFISLRQNCFNCCNYGYIVFKFQK